MATIQLFNIMKQYDNDSLVINDLNLTVSDKELLVLVGPSGCGKSTLLRIIAGLEQVTSGELYIDNELINNREPANRDIAMVFQNYALYPHMTVRGNLEYGLKNRKTPKEEMNKRIAHAAKLLEIEPFLDRKPRQLSGGQRQRVAMGRVIVRQPRVFLFDEPLSNLDAKLRAQMCIEIKTLQRSLGTTSLYVTHDQLEAMTLADRIVVMNKGRIEQIGTPMEIYDYPATIFVAGFIGSPPINFLDRQILEQYLGFSFSCNKETDILAFRPEATLLGEYPEQGPVFHAHIELIKPVGTGCHVLTRWNNIIFTVEIKERLTNDYGQKLSFTVPNQNFHTFNKQTGKRT
ncbi:carbohydrate ABC transporter ATP-binding protein, CUT1 family [Bartonella sp. CDC_skunk]|uniref:Glycerol-3-phosphate ABC transporter ATP-binding protein n=1 Tax=Bartonella rochalimae ATCC BAA-1498 TaxID=685782 RepID=E6YMW8_9HYPH|nr:MULTISPECIES: sn-glycerol-3-phosphate import ATP-binding protein UgpC [Bartonella]AQX18041.1 carbohydrate ABC transporter ATP-binding protein, CUT1 family [Bartonella sp. A1379B]AQX20973.1 carbohydrate ABC transporter ATP-binding protein, CUT1 family [Bartonella sp. CDC_skunk]AQX22556.1 sn-glycerol 3-phosphate transport system ATP-binding protein [Bartonella sp. 11B]AQX24163.1 sn-glycerol 3-phosphate transport system ATP-binding protein [Bartonella sp. 114]AQX25005.1 carbohydrate ABC transp